MDLENIASIATAVGVIFVAVEMWRAHQLARATFEDSYDQQYRELAYIIPVDALLGKPLAKEVESEVREAIYNYLDLCNDQVFQRSKRRISLARWQEWQSGIEENLGRPFFSEVWSEIKDSAPGHFSFLELLESKKFSSDPNDWVLSRLDII
mgnify:CR=1 FL=1